MYFAVYLTFRKLRGRHFGKLDDTFSSYISSSIIYEVFQAALTIETTDKAVCWKTQHGRSFN